MFINLKNFFRFAVALLVTGICAEESRPAAHHFNYSNPALWGNNYPSCLGSRQSPIDLRLSEINPLKVRPFLRWHGYGRVPENMTIQNNGHTVQIAAIWNDDQTPYIYGGVLRAKYAFAQLHFHWGPCDDSGSEHTLDGSSFPLEMHMVHYNKEYGSASEAIKHNDGLAVVGILLKNDTKENAGISRLAPHSEYFKSTGSVVDIMPFPLSEFDVNFSLHYIAYLGSLTTPPCSEIVTWLLLTQPHSVSHRQMKIFRETVLADGDDHNNRPTLPINDRIIHNIEY